jgi:hypothetical protein
MWKMSDFLAGTVVYMAQHCKRTSKPKMRKYVNVGVSRANSMQITEAQAGSTRTLVSRILHWHSAQLGCPRNNQNIFSVRTETNRNYICFGWFSVCFAKPGILFFGLFRCFGSVSKQPKQTVLFRNKPKKWKIKQMPWYHYHSVIYHDSIVMKSYCQCISVVL